MSCDEMNRRILNRGDGWLVMDKPDGMESIVKGGGNTRYCFTSLVRRSLSLPYLTPCHRLDRDTSGCLLMSTKKAMTPRLEKAFKDKAVSKAYLALTLGTPRKTVGVINAPLSRWEGGHKPVRVVKGREGQPAETNYEVLSSVEGRNGDHPAISLIRFSPLTGRTHQVRVHAASLGYPILGDDQYGDRSVNAIVKREFDLTRQALHAWRLTLPIPSAPNLREKGKITATAFLPKDMSTVLDAWVPGWQKVLKKS